ncbi:MAG: magnesium/cobalt transporter CorA [Phormidesmis sp.]
MGYPHNASGIAPDSSSARAQADTKLWLIDYSPSAMQKVLLKSPEDCTPYLDNGSISWVDVQGLGNSDVLHRLGKVFQLHPLILEDITSVSQRPKVESYGDQLVIITRMVTCLPSKKGYVAEQTSFVLGKNYLLSVQEEAVYDCLEPVRSRIEFDRGHIREMGVDYLTYCLLDAIVDGFFPVLQIYGERLEQLEDIVISKPSQKTLQSIYRLKRELSALRHLIWLQRDVLSSLLQTSGTFIKPELEIYLRDCYDHAVQLLDIVESYREASGGLIDMYLSAISNRMNEVMKTLTVISTIFIPLTFIAGIYGMNFNPEASPFNMPELNWYWGYPAVWLCMIAIASGLIFFFWRRGWFRSFL